MVAPFSEDHRLGKVSTASLTDAIGRRHKHKAHILNLVSPNPECKMFGRAATIRYVPFRADLIDSRKHNFGRLFYEAIGGFTPKGNGLILTLSSSGNFDASLGGGIKLSRLQNHKLGGLLSDGRLRDFEELKGYSFPVWCHGETPRAGWDAVMPLEANVPVTIQDVTIYPGDYIFADQSAAVVIPPTDFDTILNEAIEIEAEDRKFFEEIKRENASDILERGGREI